MKENKTPPFCPENIDFLQTNEIFIFGSNLNGFHMGGTARLAYKRFGAQWGVGQGLVNQSYAFPTLDREMLKVSEINMIHSFCNLFDTIENNKDLKFYLTKVGCGIAGWTIEEVANCFAKGLEFHFKNSFHNIPDNLYIPVEFVEFLNKK